MVGVPEYTLPAATESLNRCDDGVLRANELYLLTGLYQCSYGINYSGNPPSSSNLNDDSKQTCVQGDPFTR